MEVKEGVLIVLVFTALVLGTFKTCQVLEKKSTMNSTYTVSEATILTKFDKVDTSGNGYTIFTKPVETKHDYNFVLDLDNDGIYNKSKDITMSAEDTPYYLAKEGDKAILWEQKDESNERVRRKIVGIKDKNGKCNIIADIPCNEFSEENESYNKTKKIFEDKYLNQR